MRQWIYRDVEIRRRKDGKRFYMRVKVYRRNQIAELTIRTHRNGKGEKIARAHVMDAKDGFMLEAAFAKLAHRVGKFDFVALVAPNNFVLYE